jgi:hypothetical protein
MNTLLDPKKGKSLEIGPDLEDDINSDRSGFEDTEDDDTDFYDGDDDFNEDEEEQETFDRELYGD